jgi:predicted nucleic acid-binding protein
VNVVLDTNVFVAGVFFSGPPATILRAWREGRITLVVSPPIMDEYRRGEIGDRQLIAIIFPNGVEIVPARCFKGVEDSLWASRTIQPGRMVCDRRD